MFTKQIVVSCTLVTLLAITLGVIGRVVIVATETL